MSTPAAKRRRIDAAQALSKPFRSPFKTPFKSPVKETTATALNDNGSFSPSTKNATPLESHSSSTVLTSKSSNIVLPSTTTISSTSTHATKASAPVGRLPLPSAILQLPATPLPRPGLAVAGAHSTLRKSRYTSPMQAAALNADHDIAPLWKIQRELEKTLREVKETLDAAEQARKIENESRKRWESHNSAYCGIGVTGGGQEGLEWDGEIDGELVELCLKWKEASRRAAEELFGGVRDRVNRMGGPRAWKEAQKKREEFQNSWDQENQCVGTSNNGNEEEEDGSKEKRKVEKRDLYAEYGIDPETENEKARRTGRGMDLVEREGEEDEFTMAMMLRTLNVGLDIIGYDREVQRWMD